MTEAILLILLVTYLVTKGQRETDAIENDILIRGLKAERRFFNFWPCLWLSWFALYLLLALNVFVTFEAPYFQVMANFLNNLSGLFIFGMFCELTERTVDRGDTGGRPVWIPMLMLLVILAAIEVVLYRLVPAADRAAVTYLFGLLSGLLVGVFTGLLVARMTSRIFAFPISILVALTLYAIIQPIFPVLTATDMPLKGSIGYSIALVALYAKIALLIAIEWMRDRYILLYYMVNVAKLFDDERERHISETFEKILKGLLRPEAAFLNRPHRLGRCRTLTVETRQAERLYVAEV